MQPTNLLEVKFQSSAPKFTTELAPEPVWRILVSQIGGYEEFYLL
jgi:hypothetical protein